ncbi:ubiquitin-conjugating enzyme E2 Z-like [Acropora palmata]|uniref:ubiquitin-conjugating enzyme E2 Z-like n=1 Tax=Acropora palmata TaxID=6131 RepID=UPI003D9FC831
MAAEESLFDLLASKSPEGPCLQTSYPNETFSALCIFRIQRDIASMYKEPPPGLHISADENDITKVHALVIGPSGTPYEGGFFYFLISFTPDYPIKPPHVVLKTTGGGRVRFNPNLYTNGRVCLSILGTWQGPQWSPAQTLSSLLISIQSLMNERPYHNEPGYEKEHTRGDAKRYNDVIQHESLRVAVCEMMEGKPICPPALKSRMRKLFIKSYDSYCRHVAQNIHLDGTRMKDPFRVNEGTFDYASIKERLQNIKKSIDAEKPSGSDLDGSPYHEEDETEWSIKLPVVTTTKNPKPEIEDWVGFLYEED